MSITDPYGMERMMDAYDEASEMNERDRKIAALKEEKPKVMDKVTDAKIEAAAKAIRDLYESLQAPEDATPRQLAKVALEAAAKVEG